MKESKYLNCGYVIRKLNDNLCQALYDELGTVLPIRELHKCPLDDFKQGIKESEQ